MTIIEALKRDDLPVVVECGSRWLTVDSDGIFRVYDRNKLRTLIETPMEEVAVAVLTGEEEVQP